MTSDRFDALVLAGGHSSRMGVPKAWLKFGEQSALEYEVNNFLEAGANKVVIVINKSFIPSEKNKRFWRGNDRITVVENENIGLGRWYSIRIGLKSLIKNDNFLFIHNVDCPLVRYDTYQHLFDNRILFGATKPKFKNKSGHPVLISPELKWAIWESKNNSQILREFLSTYDVRYIETNDQHVVNNLNSLEDYRRVRHELNA